ncbi:MAG: methionine synthase [Prevotella sp.]|nr:methionine synthase [Prevotella sp.]
MDLRNCLKERILVLDGAMGTMIQSFRLPDTTFEWTGKCACCHDHHSQKGNNDMLSLLAPEVIAKIHQSYIDAGADIITTNTFSSNRISQHEYGTEQHIREINLAGARIARQVADKNTHKKIWVAGSMGPTSKTLSLSTDMNHPEERPYSFTEMKDAYRQQASALAEGGVDILLLETCFDALNAKAALCAIEEMNEEKGGVFPVMVSATINDRSGRTLTGQTLEAFFTSISHYPILSFGLNCSFGVKDLYPFIKQLSEALPCPISLHPNAGLPNEMGQYDEEPSAMARQLRHIAEEGLVNIVGGCCGTTPEHIRAIAEAVKDIAPRKPQKTERLLTVSGLETIVIDKQTRNFTNIGERTNVAGSRKFARLIAEKKYEEAASVARQQIDNGASVIDINMDDAMLNGREEMQNFVRYISNDPGIARAALMVDSSDWPTILAGLQNAQGKCIVNSISLKNGEADFLAKAHELRRYGAAVVVMAFDENGQATTYQRKTEIAARACRLLTEHGFPPQDIIFDVNILSVGTGIEEHRNYGIDFIKAVAWIKRNLPYAKTSGGVSNLSFAFRGNNLVREAMHSAFLFHAIQAGLDMGIVNPGMLQVYDDIPGNLLERVEDVILNRREDATERLISLAEEIKNSQQSGNQATPLSLRQDWRMKPYDERLAYALSKGISDFLEEDVVEALHACGENPVEVIEGPLMKGMERIGKFFAEGKMFLPQVVKAAKVMKQAVEILSPYISRTQQNAAGKQHPTVILATAKGDVHDIGKNIVAIVLACNNFHVIDLGVMVPNETILEATRQHKPLFVGVSGLITPSLKEMEDLCRLFQQEKLTVPILVGGATTSPVHTAVKLAPLYSHLVAYGGDASYSSVIAKKLLSEPLAITRQLQQEQQQIREHYEANRQEIVSFDEANRQAPRYEVSPETLPSLDILRSLESLKPTIDIVESLIDWRMLLMFWGFRADTIEQQLAIPEAAKTLEEGRKMLHDIKQNGLVGIESLLQFEPARRNGNDLVVSNTHTIPMLRSQVKGSLHLSLADFLPAGSDAPIGLFCITAKPLLPEKPMDEKSYEYLMLHALCARLAEATAEWMHGKLRELCQKAVPDAPIQIIRPAIGYPICPDHSLKRTLFDITDAERKLGISLNESYSITPSTTVCGLFVMHPQARYFTVGRIGDDQQADYQRRKDALRQ